VRAVAQVQPDELVTAAAEVEVLRAPEKPGLRRCERQRAGDGQELLAGLPIDVNATGFGFHEGLTARGCCPHAIDLTVAHGGKVIHCGDVPAVNS
jgi:hypothetical protein